MAFEDHENEGDEIEVEDNNTLYDELLGISELHEEMEKLLKK